MRYIYLLAVISFALPAFGQDVYHDNVVIVVDASSSMGRNMSGTREDKMDVAKQALKTVLKDIPDSTHVGIIAFGGVKQPWVYSLGPKKMDQLNLAVDTIYASGGTPLGDYMKQGADALLRKRQQQLGYGSYRLLVVTDGEAGDGYLVESYVPDIISRGIVLDVIGVDMKSDHSLATRAHSYRRGNDPDALKKAIEEVFAEVNATSSDDLSSDFELLKPLDNELASVMIDSLLQSGNYPIGERPDEQTSQSSSSNSSFVAWVGGSVSFVVLVVILGVVLGSRRY